MSYIHFNPRWREELVATSTDGILIFELTMGTMHVYFPDETKWNADAPAWAKDKWQQYVTACSEWAKNNRIPISITDNALFYEEKK